MQKALIKYKLHTIEVLPYGTVVRLLLISITKESTRFVEEEGWRHVFRQAIGFAGEPWNNDHRV